MNRSFNSYDRRPVATATATTRSTTFNVKITRSPSISPKTSRGSSTSDSQKTFHHYNKKTIRSSDVSTKKIQDFPSIDQLEKRLSLVKEDIQSYMGQIDSQMKVSKFWDQGYNFEDGSSKVILYHKAQSSLTETRI